LSIGVIIQARIGSSRLPGKVLKKLVNKSLLEHIIFRLSFLEKDVVVIIATTTLKADDVIEEFCNSNSILCFRGSEKNVLERYYLCSKVNYLEHVIRLTGDNPFTDIEELDNLIRLHLKSKVDYSTSHYVLPDGAGCEILSFSALEKSYLHGKSEHHKEHVIDYIEENEDIFKTIELKVAKEKNRPDIRLTIDTIDDYKKACYIIEHSKNQYITTLEAIELCSQFA